MEIVKSVPVAEAVAEPFVQGDGLPAPRTRILRRRPGQLPSERVGTTVVIDVLRMTSTAAVLMSRPSCTHVGVAATLRDLPSLSPHVADVVVVSELVGVSWPGAWVDNSPVRVSSVEVGERTAVLVTTNGTRALLAAAACADHVLLASFRDLRAVARHLAAVAAHAVALLPAGDFASGGVCVEDELCADALELLLAGREPDLAACAAIIRSDPRIRRRVEAEPGFSADLELALQGDPCAAVLKFQPLDAGVGHIMRA